MNYELIDVTCLGDTCVRHAVGRSYEPRPYQQAMLDSLAAAAEPIRVLTVKMWTCADNFRRLGKEWRRLSRPRGKQARRAAFAARQRALRVG